MAASATPHFAEPYWPAQLCTAFIIACYLLLPERLTVGPTWIVPLLAGGLLGWLVVTTRDRRPGDSRSLRLAALTLVGLVTIANTCSLALLVNLLISGGHQSGTRLIADGAVVWCTNVAVFALWFWELDGGGPAARIPRRDDRHLDWLFIQDQVPDKAPPDWHPRFVDYLYLSFTNATAFSPTDTMPLSAVAKLLMLVESLASLLTLGLVVARAVNILG